MTHKSHGKRQKEQMETTSSSVRMRDEICASLRGSGLGVAGVADGVAGSVAR